MGRTYKQDVDRASIEQLAATLESRIGRADDDGPQERALETGYSPPRTPPAAPLPPVLVAHADAGARGAVRVALQRHFEVLETADGEEAWETLAARRDIRLLLTGTRLSRLDGIGLIRRLRRANGPAHLVGLPIMVYADQEDPATKQTALLAGANDYLTPRTDRETLLGRVQARNRLFEQTRREMDPDEARPGTRNETTESEDVVATRRSERETPTSFERPIWIEARGRARAEANRSQSWIKRLYRISSTTTITLTATVLVILAITLILLLNQTSAERPASVAMGRLDVVPPERAEAPRLVPREPARVGGTNNAQAEVETKAGSAIDRPSGDAASKESGGKETSTERSPLAGARAGQSAAGAAASVTREGNAATEARHPSSASQSPSVPAVPRELTVTRRPAPVAPPSEKPVEEAPGSKAEQSKTAESPNAEQRRAEQVKAEQLKAEQLRAERVKAEQAKAEQLKTEQAKAEQAKAEQAKAEQAKAEQAKAEQARIEQQRIAQQKAPPQPVVQNKAETGTGTGESKPAAQTVDQPKTATNQPTSTAVARAPSSSTAADPETAGARGAAATPATSPPAERPAATSPGPQPASARLMRDELAALMRRFVSVYEAGDIEQFMALLAENVQTNDRLTRQAVRDDYDRLFRTTDLREMRVDTMNWDVDGDQAHGWGDFEVRVRREGDAAVYHYEGSLTLQVRKFGGRPRIERLYHSERRASR